MAKTYILDTNVLLQSPQSIYAFEDNDVVIPEVVLEELDNQKRNNDPEIRANSREAARILDSLRTQGQLYQGVPLPGGGRLRVELNCLNEAIPATWNLNKTDNRILAIAKSLSTNKENVAIITKDIFLRVKAEAIGVVAEDYRNEQVAELDKQYQGWTELAVSSADIDKLYRDEKIKPAGETELIVNQFVIAKNEWNPKHSCLAFFNGEYLRRIKYPEKSYYHLQLNTLQVFAREALLNDDIALVTLRGATGSGKTILSLAAGLEKAGIMDGEKDAKYRRILVCRPAVGLEELGYLPGNEDEKIAPYMRPIYDALEELIPAPDEYRIKKYKDGKPLGSHVQYLFDNRTIVKEAIAYLQGRTITNTWIIIDEAQNLTPKQAKIIISRAGIGTKIIFTGDPEQINTSYLDARTNGLSYTIEMMKGSPNHATITFTETKRSALAMDAQKRMQCLRR